MTSFCQGIFTLLSHDLCSDLAALTSMSYSQVLALSLSVSSLEIGGGTFEREYFRKDQVANI